MDFVANCTFRRDKILFVNYKKKNPSGSRPIIILYYYSILHNTYGMGGGTYNIIFKRE